MGLGWKQTALSRIRGAGLGAFPRTSHDVGHLTLAFVLVPQFHQVLAIQNHDPKPWSSNYPLVMSK